MYNYHNQLVKIQKMLRINNPYHYKDMNEKDLEILEEDWTRNFNNCKPPIPPERLVDVYYEVVEQKAAANNTFGIITNIDMLNGWNRLQAKVKGMQSAEKCEVCGKFANEKAGYFTSFEVSRKKNFLIKCNKQHVKG